MRTPSTPPHFTLHIYIFTASTSRKYIGKGLVRVGRAFYMSGKVFPTIPRSVGPQIRKIQLIPMHPNATHSGRTRTLFALISISRTHVPNYKGRKWSFSIGNFPIAVPCNCFKYILKATSAKIYIFLPFSL